MKWEYKIVHLNAGGTFRDAKTPTESELNELGEKGWELAASLDSSKFQLIGGRGSSTTELVFKRPVEESESVARSTDSS